MRVISFERRLSFLSLNWAVQAYFEKPRFLGFSKNLKNLKSKVFSFFEFLDFYVRIFTFSCQTL